MDDVRRRDMKLWIEELTSPGGIFCIIAILVVVFAIFPGGLPGKTFGATIGLSVIAYWGWSASVRRRFNDPRLRAMWKGVQDRLQRFEAVNKENQRKIPELSEMPETIRGIGKNLYLALRRADLIAHEIRRSEEGLLGGPPAWASHTTDAQSQELYRLADKNIAEYRQEIAGVMDGVRRTEAHAAVFMTTLDSLRVKMLGYRLVGRSPELATHDFLSAIAEARAQLQSIDTALDELDLSHYPRQISVVKEPEVQNKNADSA